MPLLLIHDFVLLGDCRMKTNNSPDRDRVAMQAGVAEPVLSPSAASPVFNFWTLSRHAVLCSADSIIKNF